jgi:hypothetical protein
MKTYQKAPWTYKERELLAHFYFHASIDEVMDKLPGRSENAIRKQVMYLRKRGYRFK